MSKQKNTTDLTKGNVFRTLVTFSIPFMAATVLQTLYSTVDMMIVGNVVGSHGLSALSTSTQLMEMIMVFCVGFCTAGQVVIAQYIGGKHFSEVKKVNSTLTIIVLMVAVVLTVLGLRFGDNFLRLLHTPEEAFSYAHDYVRVCSFGIIFTGLYNMISAVFRGMGDSRHPLIFIAIASIVNIVLDLLFVCGFGMEAAGAAWATVIGQVISVICSVTFLYRNQGIYHFSFQRTEFRLDRRIAGTICRLGIPMALQSSAVYISFLFVSSMINELGVIVSATFGATQKIRNLPNMMTQAVGLGATAMVGQNFGAGDMQRVKKVYLSGCGLNFIFCTAFGLADLLMPRQMFGLFTNDEEVLAFAGLAMFCILIELPAKIFMASGSSLINGCGNVRLSMILALCDAFIGRIFLTWFMGKYLGYGMTGYFLGYTLSTYVTAIPQVIYYFSGKWKKRKSLLVSTDQIP